MKWLKYLVLPALAVGLAIVSANASEEAAVVAARQTGTVNSAAALGG